MPADNTLYQPEDRSEREERVDRVIFDYLEAVRLGNPPSPEEVLASHPDLAEDLRSFFDDQRQFTELAGSSPALNTPRPGIASKDLQTLPLNARTDKGTGSQAPPATDLPKPASLRYFGDYELLEEIARGGMGVVYKARQVKLNRLVAVKMILAGHLAGPDDVKRFYTEAEAAANLDHPGIVPIYEVGEHGGQHYYSMGFVDGESLADMLRRTTLGANRAAALLKEVAEAIHYAHQKGVLHRDLKPANVLLPKAEFAFRRDETIPTCERDTRVDGPDNSHVLSDQAASPKVTDFGLAKQMFGNSELTGTGQVLGTPSYMSPEQAAGKSHDIGPPTDIYSLGTILYEMLLGRPPFRTESPLETMMQVIHAEPAAPRLVNASIPRDLETICLKCLRKEPEERYPSARDLADDLGRFLDGEPIHARRPSLAERASHWARKQRRSVALTLASASAAALLIVGGLLGYLGYQRYQLGHLRLRIDRPPPSAEILTLEHQPVMPMFSVPTHVPVPVTRGEYRLRITGQQRLSETYLLGIERGSTPNFNIALDDRRTQDTVDVPTTFDLASLEQGRTDVLLINKEGLVWVRDGGRVRHNLQFSPAPESLLQAAPGFHWDFQSNFGHWSAYISRKPLLVEPAPDLDRDGLNDIVYAAQHQAWLLAISSKDFKVLWIVDRTAASERQKDQQHYQASSGVFGAPVLTDDLNQDGAPDLLVTFLQVAKPGDAAPRRWIEAISGADGKSLWTRDLEPALFALPANQEPPDAVRWYVQAGGYSSSGGGFNFSSNGAFRERDWFSLSGTSHHAPMPVQLLHKDDRKLAFTVAGNQLILLHRETGELARPPVKLPHAPARIPQQADLNGDGTPDLVMLSAAPKAIAAGLLALSGKDFQPLWPEVTLETAYEHGLQPQHLPVDWPVLADLDADGACEIIVPHGSSEKSGGWARGGWGNLQVLGGRDGAIRWRQRRKTIDQHINHFIVGDDLNGDGHREVYLAALVGASSNLPLDLYVDALSGKDGTTLWWNRQPTAQPDYLQHGARLHPLQFWHGAGDGVPQLVVPVKFDNSAAPNRLFLFSSATGTLTHLGLDCATPRVADMNGDGLDELLCFRPSSSSSPEQGGQLDLIGGAPPEPWRRLGGLWTVARDYDGDEFPDLVGNGQSQIMQAISGRSGLPLWNFAADARSNRSRLVPLDEDLNGDGMPDLLCIEPDIYSAHAPLHAHSGKTGRRIWSADFQIRQMQNLLEAQCIDLDADGKPELVFVAAMDLGYPVNRSSWGSDEWQIWLVVLSARTGLTRWRVPLTEPKSGMNSPLQDTLKPFYADLNNDGSLEIVTLAVLPDRTPELRAYQGKTGELLWKSAVTNQTRDNYSLLRQLASPIAADLNGDGQDEIVHHSFTARRSPEGGMYTALLTMRNGSTGQVEHSVDFTVDWNTASPVQQDEEAWYRPRPLPLRTHDPKRRLLAIWTWGYPGSIIVYDANLKEVSRREVRAVGPRFRVWAADIDGNQTDELLVSGDGHVTAWPIEGDAPRWKWPIPGKVGDIIDVRPGIGARTAEILVAGNAAVHCLAGATGELRWSCQGPRSISGRQFPAPMQLLHGGDSQFPPTILFRAPDEVTVCRQAIAPGDQPPLPKSIAANRVATARSDDPRLLRHLPWALPYESAYAEMALQVGLSCLMATMLYVIPGAYLLRLFRRRTWSLRAWMLLPVIASVMLLAQQVPLRESGAASALARFGFALPGLPIVVSLLFLLQWLCLGKFKAVLFWCLVIVVLSVVFATIGIALDWSNLEVGERYSWQGWYLVFGIGGYTASWLALIGAVTWRFIMYLIAWRKLRRAAA